MPPNGAPSLRRDGQVAEAWAQVNQDGHLEDGRGGHQAPDFGGLQQPPALPQRRKSGRQESAGCPPLPTLHHVHADQFLVLRTHSQSTKRGRQRYWR